MEMTLQQDPEERTLLERELNVLMASTLRLEAELFDAVRRARLE